MHFEHSTVRKPGQEVNPHIDGRTDSKTSVVPTKLPNGVEMKIFVPCQAAQRLPSIRKNRSALILRRVDRTVGVLGGAFMGVLIPLGKSGCYLRSTK